MLHGQVDAVLSAEPQTHPPPVVIRTAQVTPETRDTRQPSTVAPRQVAQDLKRKKKKREKKEDVMVIKKIYDVDEENKIKNLGP